MNQRKQNISRWYALGLALVLAAGCMILSVGTAFARYRLDDERQIEFASRLSAQVAVGTVGTEEEFGTACFLPDGVPQWVTLSENGTQAAALDFAISNYLGESDYDSEDIRVRIRLIGSLEAWDPEGNGTVTITDGDRTWTAAVSPIGRDTALYHTFGEGWVFEFPDEDGGELTWILEGGDLTWTRLRITMTPGVPGTSLVQLQVSGERVD